MHKNPRKKVLLKNHEVVQVRQPPSLHIQLLARNRADPATKQNMFYLTKKSTKSLLLLFTCNHCSNWTWVVEEILAYQFNYFVFLRQHLAYNIKLQFIQTFYQTKLSLNLTFSTFSNFDTSGLLSFFWFQTSETEKFFFLLRYLSLFPGEPSNTFLLKVSRISNKNFEDCHL